MKNRAHHEGLKCSPHEITFAQSMKVGLKTSNLPDETINDIQTEEELEEIISATNDENETTMQQQQSNNVAYIPQINTSGEADDQAVSNYEIQREAINGSACCKSRS